MSRILHGRDGGGRRCFLDNRPIHAGTGLEIRLPGGAWIRVRYESGGRDRILLHLPMGGAWEDWKPPAGLKEGDEYEVECPCCKGTKTIHKGDRCYSCSGRGTHTGMVLGDPSKVTDCQSCAGTGKATADDGCWECWRSKEEGSTGKKWRQVERPYAPSVPLDVTDHLDTVDVRWPVSR